MQVKAAKTIRSKSVLGGVLAGNLRRFECPFGYKVRFLCDNEFLGFGFFLPRLHLNYAVGWDYELAAACTIPCPYLGGAHVHFLVFDILPMLP